VAVPDATEPDPPHLRFRDLTAGGSGSLLLLILGSLTLQLAVSPGEGTHAATIMMQAAIIILAVHVWQPHQTAGRVVLAAVGLVLAATVIAIIVTGEVTDDLGRISSLLLAAFAPAIIVAGIVNDMRTARAITVRSMFGALSLYLLIGLGFAFAYGTIESLSATGFDGREISADQSDYLYFSFVTMTTTGYGDLVAASDLGRSLAITQALIGQLYPVTVLALIVSNLRRPSRRRSTAERA
jgi:Ion channel